ncbi:MAG: hypothetical protein ACFFAH_12850 [Promethearchaeota archaeon]
MAIDIFKLDWIFIDFVIILLLLLVLISVKLFKERSRWRTSLSNDSLEFINYRQSDIHLKSQDFTIKNMSIVRHISLKNEMNSYPIILLCKPSKKRKLLYALTEGLASYGFEIIIVDIEDSSNHNENFLDNKLKKEKENIFSSIIDFLVENEVVSHSNYILINFSIPYFSFKSIFSDPKNHGIFLLNPKLNKINMKFFSEVSELINLQSPVNIIFSKNLSFFISNKNLNKFLKVFNNENSEIFRLFVVEKARTSFKNYETILLSLIIHLINKNFLND